MSEPVETRSAEQQLADAVAEYYADPYGFVMFAFPWGDGELKGRTGPDDWQRGFLLEVGRLVEARGFNGVDPVDVIRESTASGHGIGKSALVAWLILWLMSTRPFAKGVVTANTSNQLETKTWAELQKWHRRCITGHWFSVVTLKMYHKEHKDEWRVDGITCKEENSEAFAGLHAANSTPFYIFDEASAVPDAIWNVAEGGLTDGEPMFFAFGNPTRRSGRFYENTFGRLRHRWHKRSIDSRSCLMPNKALIAEWEQDYGEDSDFFRVRVRGLPPSASDLAFIASTVLDQAMTRNEPSYGVDDPLIMTFDVARGGVDKNVIRFRRGLDARSIPPVKVPGSETRNTMRMVAKVAQLADQYQPDAIFVDATGVGGPVLDRLQQLGYSAFEVQFGGASPDKAYANMRSYMAARAKEWLAFGALDADPELRADAEALEYTHDKKDRLILESKEHMKARGIPSPDDWDAFAMSFAYPVAKKRRTTGQTSSNVIHDYNPE